MVTVEPRRGGFKKRPVQLGPYLQQMLAGGAQFYALQLYESYKEAVRAVYEQLFEANETPQYKRHYPKVISIAGFLSYLYKLRRLGWIEYIRDNKGNIVATPAHDKAGTEVSYLTPRYYFQITSAGSAADWSNIQLSYEDII